MLLLLQFGEDVMMKVRRSERILLERQEDLRVHIERAGLLLMLLLLEDVEVVMALGLDERKSTLQMLLLLLMIMRRSGGS